jgi:hypothetical protein
VQDGVDVANARGGETGVEFRAVQALDVGGGEGVELYPSQGRADVMTHLQLVVRERPRADVALDAALEPSVQVRADREVLGVEDHPVFPVGEPLSQLLRYFPTGLAVKCLPLAPLGRVDGVLGAPAAVLAAVDRVRSVPALLAQACSSCQFHNNYAIRYQNI